MCAYLLIIKVFLFAPQEWGTEGVEVLKTLFTERENYFKARSRTCK